MTDKQAERRETLRGRILEAAEARIVAGGIANLRAREIMADAGAALGGLYNVFADLDDVVLHVNSRTLARLGETLAAASGGAADPGAALRALALAYLGFAEGNRALWSALFDYRYGANRGIPDWHLAEQAVLLVHIVEPLRRLRPDWSEDFLQLRARTLFGAIHGIVAISLEERFVGLSGKDLATETADFVDVIVAGTRGDAEGQRGCLA
ncbi:TetR/AcrR family transcriptional regulator [Aureimonas psammosilenae]|uniref:TetR/AcrR family transcriptional regulator n=1 Tax=Aureimonas psammosilenae TaxID=2495496 RepID=UPI0012611573|nr:TetR/AcrR family transcriptional regulator [Aureimonas psammosilenae]